MKDRHILEILDRAGFSGLEGAQLATVRQHCAECADCRKSFEAARISAVLLNARSELAPVEPSVFFQSKVLNALREKQQLRNPLEAFRRWWQASYTLVCSMLFFVITLALLTMLAPKPDSAQAASNGYLYTTDAVILNQNPPQNVTTEQALEVIYAERRGNAVKR
jgi:hypothetical protein